MLLGWGSLPSLRAGRMLGAASFGVAVQFAVLGQAHRGRIGSRFPYAIRMGVRMMGGTEFLAMLALVANAIETPVVEGVAVTQVVETYPVTGITSRRLLDELNANARVDEADGSRTYGVADVAVNWSYTYKTRAGAPCAIDTAQVKLDIKIRLPDWQPASAPPVTLGAQWQNFHDSLTRHELKHREFGVEAARQVRETLARLKAPTCDAVNAEADRRTALIMKRMSEINHAYDLETDHGRTEGAFWHAE